MNQVVIEETSFEEVLSEIEENSKYKRLPPKEKTWMTVPEIGNLLGLKKTGRYWLVQKNHMIVNKNNWFHQKFDMFYH